MVVLVNLGQGHGFVQLAELVLVGGLIDNLLEDEGLDELVLASLEIRHLPLGGGPQGGNVFFPGLPDIHDDGAEEAHELGAWPEALKEAHELGLQLAPPDVRLAAAGLRRAVIVGVALAPAVGPGTGEGLATVAAGRERPEGEIRVVALLRHDLALRDEKALASPEGVFIDQGGPIADGLDIPGALDDPADVDAVREHLAPLLRGQLAVLPGAEAPPGELFEDLCLGVQASGEALEAKPDQRSALRIELQGLVVRQVAQRRLPDPLTPAHGFLHASLGPPAPDVIVELGEGGENTLHELAGRGLVDRLADRSQSHAEPGQVPADDGMIEGVAREAVHIGDHEDVDIHAPLVLLPQVRQSRLQLGAVGGLGGLAALQEDAVDLPAVQLAEGSALFLLDGEREVEGLLFATDAAIDDRPK